MMPIEVNPKAIKVQAKGKAMMGPTTTTGFQDVLGGVSAFGPAMGEFFYQGGASDLAGAVLNAAFSGIDAMSPMSQTKMMGSGYLGGYSSSPGMFGTGKYSTNNGYVDGTKYAASTSGNIDDPAAYQYEIMTTMNQNNLKLLELQALMQANMQSWTTKSNILSADHRARMAMIEKFSARG